MRRLPAIAGHSMVSRADLARNVDPNKVGDVVEAIFSEHRLLGERMLTS